MPICWSKRELVNAGRWAWVLLATLFLSIPCHAAGESPIRSIKVDYQGDTYITDAVMYAPVQIAVAWDVLTDFDHMANWVPNVKESKVLKRENSSVTIEQRGTAKFGAASFGYVTERHLDMDKPSLSIKSVQTKGNLKRVESLMKLEPDGSGTRLVYHIEIIPSLIASAVMSKSFLEHEITEQFTAIIGEMTKRAQ
jgi:carbon monoxide dehydrogenase subunit G